MSTLIVPDWEDTRVAVSEEAARVAALVRSARRPDAPALGQWSVADIATHVAQALEAITGLATAATGSLVDDIWSLGDLTMTMVAGDEQRDLGALADRIEAGAKAFLAAVAAGTVDDTRAWIIEGMESRPSHLTCHVLNELVVHGFDIARAEGRRWKVDRDHAAMIIMGFIVPVIAKLPPRAMVDQRKAAGVKASFQLRLRGHQPAGRVVLRIEDGALSVEAPDGQRIDCYASGNPAALLVIIWGRRSQYRYIATGQLLAWGRRPWLGLRLKPMLRNP